VAETLFDELKALCPKEEVTPDNVKASAFWSPVGLVRQYARLLNALPHLLAVVEAAQELLVHPVGSDEWVRAEARLATALAPLFKELPDD
jgi:hypothetical protein